MAFDIHIFWECILENHSTQTPVRTILNLLKLNIVDLRTSNAVQQCSIKNQKGAISIDFIQ